MRCSAVGYGEVNRGSESHGYRGAVNRLPEMSRCGVVRLLEARRVIFFHVAVNRHLGMSRCGEVDNEKHTHLVYPYIKTPSIRDSCTPFAGLSWVLLLKIRLSNDTALMEEPCVPRPPLSFSWPMKKTRQALQSRRTGAFRARVARTARALIVSMADDAGSMMEGPVSEPWEPLSVVDVSLLGLVGTFQAFAVLICVHLIWCRKWPPYVTKNVDLVVTSTVAGVLWTFAMANSFGLIRRERGDILAACDFEVCSG